MTDREKELTDQLKEAIPKSLLTDEQFAKVWQMDNTAEAVKYINSVTNEGLKASKAYYDLYVDVLPDRFIPRLGARLVSYDNGWGTIDITYNGEVIKTINF